MNNETMKLIKTRASSYHHGLCIYTPVQWSVVDSDGNKVCEVENGISGWEIIITTDEGKKRLVPDSETGKTWKHTSRKQVSDLALAWATNL